MIETENLKTASATWVAKAANSFNDEDEATFNTLLGALLTTLESHPEVGLLVLSCELEEKGYHFKVTVGKNGRSIWEATASDDFSKYSDSDYANKVFSEIRNMISDINNYADSVK